MKLYLDNCCFNRPFDDQSHLRIRLEAEAKLRVQEEIRSGSFELVWSYILDYENSKNPFYERKSQIALWREHSASNIQEDEEVLQIAQLIHDEKIKKLDSLHIACAIVAKADYFLTTDDGILNKSASIKDIKVTDPIGFIKEALA